ncbi:MAG: methanogenesis marker protein 11 [Methanotrichaceae archaeon]
MLSLEDPYTVVYKQIHAICSPEDELVEILECSDCYGGSAWSRHHYTKGPLVISSRSIGNWFRYLVHCGTADLGLTSSKRSAGFESVLIKGDTVEITYAGLGGGGVGATVTRAGAGDVIRSKVTESGGGRVGRGTIVLPRRERLIIGVDDTDSKTEGATWSLVHNISAKVDRPEARYISHSLVQLFPVPTKTQNCVSTAVEFACLPGRSNDMLKDFRYLLERYSVSDDIGMVIYRGFDPSPLMPYAHQCKTKRISYELAVTTAEKTGAEVMIGDQGLIGALAAIPFYAMPDESVKPEI